MTLEQLLKDVTRAAEALRAIQPQHGEIHMTFHRVNATPAEVAIHLAQALPGWPPAKIVAVPSDGSADDFDTAWAAIQYQRVRITAFVTQAHATAYLASKTTAKAA